MMMMMNPDADFHIKEMVKINKNRRLISRMKITTNEDALFPDDDDKPASLAGCLLYHLRWL